MRRWLVRIIIAGFLVLVVGVGGAIMYLDQLGRWGVERGATYALGVPTTLAGLHIGIISGSVSLSGLDVPNPEGFASKQFMGLGDGRVAVSLGSLMEDTVELPELTLRDIDLSLERRGGKANYQPIMDNLARLGSGGSGAPAAEQGQPGKKFVIRKVVIEDITVDAQMTSIGGDLTRVPVTIERIELTDLGTDSDQGVLMSELTGIVMKAILSAVVKKAGSFLPEGIAGDLGDGLAKLGNLGETTVAVVGDVKAMVGGELTNISGQGREFLEGLKDGQAIEGVRDAAGSLKDGAKDAGKDVKEGLGRILGREKKKDNDNDGG